jgi:uncharacterized membrane protein
MNQLMLNYGYLDRIEDEFSRGIVAVQELRMKKKDNERNRESRLREKTTVIAGDFSQISFDAFEQKYENFLGRQCAAIAGAFAITIFDLKIEAIDKNVLNVAMRRGTRIY